MKIKEYLSFMQSLSEYAKRVGLNSEGVYKHEVGSKSELWVLSVSSKTSIYNFDVLTDDDMKIMLASRLNYPIIVGSKDEIGGFIEKAKKRGADYFTKKNIAADCIAPSPEFLNLEKVVQAEYFFHESFHATPKSFMGAESLHFPLQNVEESHAFLTGHLAAVDYFAGTELESASRNHFKKHFGFAADVCNFYSELKTSYKSDISSEQKLEKREAIFQRAEKVFGTELDSPVNNAFFVYWNFYYGLVPQVYNDVKTKDINNVINKLLKF